MSEHPPAAASRGPWGRVAGIPLTLKTAALAALCIAGAALLLALPPSQRPSPDPPLPPASAPSPEARSDAARVRSAAPHPLTSTDPSLPSVAEDDDSDSDDDQDTASEYLLSANDSLEPTEILVPSELAPRAPVTAEPLVPVEIVVQAELAPRIPVTSEPLVPIEVRADAELAPRTPVSTAPLVPRVLIDPPDPPAR